MRLKRAAIALATFVLKAVYLATYHLAGPRHQIVCLSRQSDEIPIDFTQIEEYVREHHPDYRVVSYAKTLSNPLGYIPHTLLQAYEIARSEAVVLDSYCIAVSLLNTRIKAPVIQLWHAMGNMKRFGYAALDEPEGRSSSMARLMHMHEGYDCVVISSLAFIDDYVAGFHVSPDIVFESPLPKADLLIDRGVRKKRKGDILRRYPQLSGKKNIVYCPTFRKPSTEADRRALELLANSIDYDRYNLIYKAHPVSALRFEDSRVFQEHDPSLDMLYVADYVISDYSTVIYEAGLLDVPVLLYTYDWETYRRRRGLNIDYSKDVPVPTSSDPKVLMDHIERDEFDLEGFRAFVRRYVRVPEGESCTQRITEHIFSLVKQADCVH